MFFVCDDPPDKWNSLEVVRGYTSCPDEIEGRYVVLLFENYEEKPFASKGFRWEQFNWLYVHN